MNNVTVLKGSEVSLGSCEVTNNSLTIPPGTSFEDWESIGASLKEIRGAVMWWIGDWLNFGESTYGETYAQAIEVTEYEYQTLVNAKWVSSKYELSFRNDNLTWTHHRIALFADDPIAALKWAEAGGKDGNRATIVELREHVRDEKRGIHKPIPLPPNKYDLIYADPPWRYEFSETDSRKIENHYPTMELDDICALPVQDIAADNCVLFMWATSPKLSEAMRVIEDWGFDYRTSAIWTKPQLGMGYYFRQQHEFLLVAVKGSPGVPKPEFRVRSVMEFPRTKHSAKPKQYYEIIEQMYPLAKRIELFCREARDGWSVWGNQVEAA